jgi:hypothetical protein
LYTRLRAYTVTGTAKVSNGFAGGVFEAHKQASVSFQNLTLELRTMPEVPDTSLLLSNNEGALLIYAWIRQNISHLPSTKKVGLGSFNFQSGKVALESAASNNATSIGGRI